MATRFNLSKNDAIEIATTNDLPFPENRYRYRKQDSDLTKNELFVKIAENINTIAKRCDLQFETIANVIISNQNDLMRIVYLKETIKDAQSELREKINNLSNLSY